MSKYKREESNDLVEKAKSDIVRFKLFGKDKMEQRKELSLIL
jgi:hypothetical protein